LPQGLISCSYPYR